LALDDLPARAIGTADEPDLQQQSPFGWEPAAGNLLLFGVAGSGTTTALSTLALALARAHRPDQLHMYVLDFGTGGLAPLAGLPHVGAVVVAGERERHERLMRLLRGQLQERRRALAAGARHEWPVVVLLVDNLGGLHAAYDDLAWSSLRQDLVTVLADGPSLGVAVAASADRPGAVPSAMTSLAPHKLVFRLADSHDYASFGLGAAQVPRPCPGRAVDLSSGREVQVALPWERGGHDEGLAAAVASAAVASATEVSQPPPLVAVLPERVGMDEVLGAARLDGAEWFLPVGIGDEELAPAGIVLGEGDHALVAGPARSGKSTVLGALAAVVCPRRSPLLDARVDEAITGDDAVGEAVAGAVADGAPHLVLVDDAELVDDPSCSLSSVLARRRPGVHVVAAGRADALRTAYGHWVAEVRRSRKGLALRPHAELDGDLWHTELPRRRAVAFGPGRGYLVGDGQVELVQAVGP
ncbi:MAG TPA: FtsK/SpoIIIE domain-containing protein, partial [Acidimicrobiales bacterium]|nr:FtsK/SpoIIIE domain-containing protein [Acidimicrobiales bacterium]